MSNRLIVLARVVVLTGGLLALAGPLPAQLPFPKFSLIKEQPSSGELSKGLVTNLGIRPNTELPYYLYVINPGAEVRTNLKVYVTADKLGNQILFTGSVKRLEKKGDEGSNVWVPLQSVKKAAPEAATAPSTPGAAPAPKPPAPAIPKVLYIHILKVENNVESLLQEDQQPTRVEVNLRRPTEYLTVSDQRVIYNEVSQTFDVSMQVSDRSLSRAGVDNQLPFEGEPSRVRLDLRPELVPGLEPDSIRDGTFQTLIEPGKGGYVLSVKNLKITGEKKTSFITISVDGYERAFVFRTNFPVDQPGTQSTLQYLETPFTRIDLPRYSTPGKELSAKLEVFGDNQTLLPEFTFERTKSGTPELLSRDLKGPRDVKIGAKISDSGELVLSSIVQDWAIPVDTRGVFGERTFKLTLKGGQVDPNEKSYPVQLSSEHKLTLDYTPPEGATQKEISLLALPIPKPKPPAPPVEEDECTRKEEERQEKKELLAKLKKAGCEPPPGVPLVLPKKGDIPLTPEQQAAKAKAAAEELRLSTIPVAIPSKVIKGTAVTFVVQAFDKESEIDKVIFFSGPAPGPDNKASQGGKVYPAQLYMPLPADNQPALPTQPTGGYYSTVIEMPDKPGVFEYGVRVINKAGLVSEVLGDLKVVEPDPPAKPKEKPTTGTINGSVVQGDRPQRGLEVKLFNGDGKVVMQTETDETGSFQFCKVPPGAYRVYAIKLSDAGARDTKSVIVKAGKESEAQLELLRR